MYVSQEWSCRRAFPDASIGTGRPDQQDEKELLEFAAKIMQNSEAQRTPAFPGNRPYREYGGVPLKPVANGKCTSCGLCAKECPAGAIRWTIRR